MTDRDALLASIVADPDDDTPRLVFADWCDEHGDAADRARATFIRAQIEYSQLPNLCENPGNSPDVLLDSITSNWFYRKRCRCKVCKLRRAAYQSSCRFIVWDWNPWAWEQECRPHIDSWSRGFPEKVTLPNILAWERHGESIVRAAPVVEIRIAELVSYHNGAGHAFFNLGRERPRHEVPIAAELPWWAFRLLRDYEKAVVDRWKAYSSPASALTAAARAFADESRCRAGLEPVWVDAHQGAGIG